jgi:hypothetical protein
LIYPDELTTKSLGIEIILTEYSWGSKDATIIESAKNHHWCLAPPYHTNNILMFPCKSFCIDFPIVLLIILAVCVLIVVLVVESICDKYAELFMINHIQNKHTRNMIIFLENELSLFFLIGVDNEIFFSFIESIEYK